MTTIKRNFKSQKVTVKTRKGEVLSVHYADRKTDEVKEFQRALKKFNRVDLEITVEDYEKTLTWNLADIEHLALENKPQETEEKTEESEAEEPEAEEKDA